MNAQELRILEKAFSGGASGIRSSSRQILVCFCSHDILRHAYRLHVTIHTQYTHRSEITVCTYACRKKGRKAGKEGGRKGGREEQEVGREAGKQVGRYVCMHVCMYVSMHVCMHACPLFFVLPPKIL